MARLTKEALLSGINNVVELKLESRKGSVMLRPLSQAEVGEYNNIQARAMGTFDTNERARRGMRNSSDVTSSGKLNFAKTSEAQYDAQRYAVAKSMTCKGEEYSEEEVGGFDGALFYEIFDKVKEISGIEDEDIEEEVEQFPEN
ncbi:hypothetical protein [Methanobrevibacter sp.]|uniref:hypothetical protein n=1 Tax=Methanobrevibacter sp. TaxID=66852 RepID=UPI00386A8614